MKLLVFSKIIPSSQNPDRTIFSNFFLAAEYFFMDLIAEILVGTRKHRFIPQQLREVVIFLEEEQMGNKHLNPVYLIFSW